MLSSGGGRSLLWGCALALLLFAASGDATSQVSVPSCFVPTGPLQSSHRPGFNLERKCARSPPKLPGLRMSGIEEFIGDFKVGDTVKLAKSMEAFHLNPRDPEATMLPAGLEGKIIQIVTDKHPKATPNFPIVVQFQEPKKFRMHMEATDLEHA